MNKLKLLEEAFPDHTWVEDGVLMDAEIYIYDCDDKVRYMEYGFSGKHIVGILEKDDWLIDIVIDLKEFKDFDLAVEHIRTILKEG